MLTPTELLISLSFVLIFLAEAKPVLLMKVKEQLEIIVLEFDQKLALEEGLGIICYTRFVCCQLMYRGLHLVNQKVQTQLLMINLKLFLVATFDFISALAALEVASHKTTQQEIEVIGLQLLLMHCDIRYWMAYVYLMMIKLILEEEQREEEDPAMLQ